MAYNRMDQRVILCVIRPQDELPTRLSHTDLYRFFSQFGTVKDVEIFSRKVLIKAFVEFGSPAEAEKALRTSHDQLTTFGKMQAFFSNKNSIIKRTKATPLNIASLGNLTDLQWSPRNNKLAFLSSFPSQALAFKLPTVADARQMPSFGFQAPQFTKAVTSSTGNDLLAGDSAFNLDSNAGVSLGPIFGADGEVAQPSETKKMRVLMVNRINTKAVTVRHLFNLFSCYGNVNKVLINKENNYALVQFQTGQQALNAVEKLKNIEFFGQTLKVKVSRYSSLNFKTLEKESNDKLSHLHGSPALFRFANNSSDCADAPASFLRIGHVPVALGPTLIHAWLDQCHEPERVVVHRDVGLDTNTVYAGFSSVRQAVEVLSCLHAQQINEKTIDISFCSSKEAFES